ncbi:MAG: class I SAM-dependent methyltransferase [Candidatus Magasanikbacteria bacterium]
MKKKEPIEVTIETYNHIAEDYDNSYSDLDWIKDNADKFIEELEGDKVLDAGCGSGRDAKYFSENNLEVLGIDLSEEMLKRAEENSPNAYFKEMDVRQLNFSQNSFDGIWCCALLPHIPKEEINEAVKELKRVLKPEGTIFMSFKQGEGEKFVEKDRYNGNQKFFAYYTKDEIKELLNSHNFKIKNIFLENSEKFQKNLTWISIFATI